MDINPWVLGASYVSIGGLRRILKFADTSKMASEDVQDIQFSVSINKKSEIFGNLWVFSGNVFSKQIKTLICIADFVEITSL